MAINHISPELEQARPPIAELPDTLIASSFHKSTDHYYGAEAVLRDRLFAAGRGDSVGEAEQASIAQHWALRNLIKRELHITEDDQHLVRFARSCLRKAGADHEQVIRAASQISDTETLRYFARECHNWFSYNMTGNLPRRFKRRVPARYKPDPITTSGFLHLAAATRFGLAVTSGRTQVVERGERFLSSFEHHRLLDQLDEAIKTFSYSLIANDKPALAIAFGNIVSDPYETNWDGEFVSYLAYELIALRDKGNEDRYLDLHDYSMQTLSPIKRYLMGILLPVERAAHNEIPLPTDQVA